MTERARLDGAGLAALLRPRIAGLVLVVAGAGFLLERPSDLAPLAWLLPGTLLVAAAGCALNHWAEADADRAMIRTRRRPLVTGALRPWQVVVGGVLALLAGLGLLAAGAGILATALHAAAIGVYLGVYTPLKRRTSANTWVGAIPGALPLLAGAAAAGGPSTLAWLAFALLFLWQLPHFFAIASMYRDDYATGGLRMLSGDDPDDALLRWQMPLQVMSVMLISLLPAVLGLAGLPYLLPALLVGLLFLGAALAFRRRPDRGGARRVVLASVTYLPCVLGALVLDVACQPIAGHDETGAAAGVPCAGCASHAASAEPGAAACCPPPEDQVTAAHAPISEEEEPDDVAARLAALTGQPAPAPVEDGTGLPNYGELPAFSLIAEDGQPFSRDSLLGQVWVVDFIFTSCAGPCPVMSQKYVELERGGLEARLLSVTVDPRRDGPEQLAAYRERHGGSPDKWRLLTGPRDAIQALGEGGFRMPINAGDEPMLGMGPMAHSGKFALLDGAARVRGYYDHADQLGMAQMQRDAAALSRVTVPR